MRAAPLAAALCAVLLGAPASAQENEPPPACRYNAAGQVDFAACLAVAAPGSPWRTLSLINLGTQAFLAADYAAAVRYYDDAQPSDGTTFYSDASYHAFRAAALQHVGRPAEAIVEARRALAVLRNDDAVPAEVRASVGSVQQDPDIIYAAILPVLHTAADPEMDYVRGAYAAIPARDWISWANRAGVLEQIGDLDGALHASTEALRLQPSHPAVLNNHCYVLTRASKAAEALSYCEAARAGAPQVAGVRHSLASALAALGRCDSARAELAEARRLDPVSLEYQSEIACTSQP